MTKLKAIGQNAYDCLDTDGEEGGVWSGLSERWIKTFFHFDEKSPSNNVEARKGPRGGQSRASRWTLKSG